MKRVIITAGEEDLIFEEVFKDDQEILDYLEGERAGGNRWIRAWVWDGENLFKDFEDPTSMRSIPPGAISREDKKIICGKKGEVIGHYRIDLSSPIRIFYKGRPVSPAMLKEDPNLERRIDDMLLSFRRGCNDIQSDMEILERMDLRIERDIESLVYYQEYSLK